MQYREDKVQNESNDHARDEKEKTTVGERRTNHDTQKRHQIAKEKHSLRADWEGTANRVGSHDPEQTTETGGCERAKEKPNLNNRVRKPQEEE
jgi:hypothetical protein